MARIGFPNTQSSFLELIMTSLFEKIAFIHYATKNLERAVGFYRDVLGLKLLLQTEEWAEFDIGGQRFAVHQLKSSETFQAINPAVVSLQTHSIENAIETLKNKGVRFVQELQIRPHGKMAIFQDLDGNLLGLYQPPSEKSHQNI